MNGINLCTKSTDEVRKDKENEPRFKMMNDSFFDSNLASSEAQRLRGQLDLQKDLFSFINNKATV